MSDSHPSFTTHAYRGAEDLRLMQQAIASWIQQAGTCAYPHVGDLPHRIYNGLRGRYPREEMIRLWMQADRLAGFAMAYPRHKAYDAWLAPAYRASDLEREMLEWAYTTTRTWMDRDGAHDLPITPDTTDCDHQRIALLLDLGYQPEDTPWLVVNEREITADLPESRLPEGYHIRSATGDEEAAALAAVHSAAFGSGWTEELYREEVMRKPGYDPALEHVVVAPDGAFAAFCITWLDDINQIGLFEPVGTAEAYQRQGLGRALMAYGLRFMREQGMRTVQVCNATDNPAASGLYQSMGFVPKHQVFAYRKH